MSKTMAVLGCKESRIGSHVRWMTTSRRVQDRSKKKRVHELEIVTEKWKIVSKILYIIDVLKMENEQIIPIRSLERHRQQINLPKPYKISDFIKRSPKLFEIYKDPKGILWCGMTKMAEDLVEEEKKVLEEHATKAAEHVTRFLMMSIDKRLPVDKIAHFRRDFGLPHEFRTTWVHQFPENFRVVESEDDVEYLELVSWNPSWAVTELEKKKGIVDFNSHTPGLLSLPFPMRFPPHFKKVFRFSGKLDDFQKRDYLSPYADARELNAGSHEFDKRAVAVMHELLSFTIEKRLVTDHLTHFRHELVMPQKLMRLLLKHFGIFYVSEKGKRFSVFLTEAYKGTELIEKCPLVLWREKVLRLAGCAGKKKRIQTCSDLSTDDVGLFESDSENESIRVELEESDVIRGVVDDDSDGEGDEMDVSEIQSVYEEMDVS